MNNIVLTGRLTEQPDVKQTQGGAAVCRFTIAVKRPNTKDVTDFIYCVAWRNTAEFVGKYFGKGQMIAVQGVLTSRKYDDHDGNKRTAFEVAVDRAEFCESKKTEEGAQNQPKFEEVPDNGDLPF